MVVGVISTYVFSAYHHWSCEFNQSCIWTLEKVEETIIADQFWDTDKIGHTTEIHKAKQYNIEVKKISKTKWRQVIPVSSDTPVVLQ